MALNVLARVSVRHIAIITSRLMRLFLCLQFGVILNKTTLETTTMPAQEKEITPILSSEVFNQICDMLNIGTAERKFIKGLNINLELGGYVNLEISRIACKEE